MRIYNIFPLLAGRFGQWDEHLKRAASMGFNWIFLNPIQQPGLSGSLYSIKDYFGCNPLLVDERVTLTPEHQLGEAMDRAKGLGLSVMVDLVINHCAIDSPLVTEHPEWFAHDKKGRVAHPWCMDGAQKVVWGDLAMFDHKAATSGSNGLYDFYLDVIGHLAGLGFKGFRCDAAYQLPQELWERLINDSRARHGENLVFAAETLGCSHEQTMETASAGFGYIFNSSKWWDFKSPWLLEQYNNTRTVAPSISFPESHDTLRLCEEFKGNIDGMRQRYLFSAAFSTGVMIPMGFEFGFRKRMHVVKTRPSDWENTGVDITADITEINAMKARLPILSEEAPAEILDTGDTSEKNNQDVLMLLKTSKTDGSRLLLVMNRDMNNEVEIDLPEKTPRELMGAQGPIHDETPGGKHTTVDAEAPMLLTLPAAGSIVLHAPQG